MIWTKHTSNGTMHTTASAVVANLYCTSNYATNSNKIFLISRKQYRHAVQVHRDALLCIAIFAWQPEYALA